MKHRIHGVLTRWKWGFIPSGAGPILMINSSKAE